VNRQDIQETLFNDLRSFWGIDIREKDADATHAKKAKASQRRSPGFEKNFDKIFDKSNAVSRLYSSDKALIKNSFVDKLACKEASEV